MPEMECPFRPTPAARVRALNGANRLSRHSAFPHSIGKSPAQTSGFSSLWWGAHCPLHLSSPSPRGSPARERHWRARCTWHLERFSQKRPRRRNACSSGFHSLSRRPIWRQGGRAEKRDTPDPAHSNPQDRTLGGSAVTGDVTSQAFTVYGANGNDTLKGSLGTDTLDGGEGNDLFLTSAGSVSGGADVYSGGQRQRHGTTAGGPKGSV